MINFPGIPNTTIYSHTKVPQKHHHNTLVKATIYKHATGLNATVRRRATDTPKMPPQHPVNATVYMPNFTNEKINIYQ